ncbi:Uu.00g097500.m01.CDS01 [Anthostomella pinea]|uniref:Uu.00g097500.m01.CDS01 n=1 Tax=Anthostomella pinea TaxID=933095 RepID=A0AAI8VCI1_9PEZI|nr:Uu.00g097500.m01.CDS01 [Anthostomella pinea]
MRASFATRSPEPSRDSEPAKPGMEEDKFRHDPLDLRRHAFRLVCLQRGTASEIKCELIHTTLDGNVIPYEAVSYTWGSAVKTDSVDIQGTRLRVTLNLWNILHGLRHSETDRYLWIDAISINQDDPHERGHQVQQMGHIYSGAERVIFCLGRPTDTSHTAMSTLAELQKEVSGNRWAREDKRWDTAWETVRARLRDRHYDLSHRQRLGMNYILEGPGFAEYGSCKKWPTLAPPWFTAAPIASRHESVLDMMPKSSTSVLGWIQDRSLYSLLRRFSGSEATDERDRVYALIGLCTPPSSLSVDYTKSVTDVIGDTMVNMFPTKIWGLPKTPIYLMDNFLAYLESIDSDLLLSHIRSSNTKMVQSLLRSRDYIRITSEMASAAAVDETQGKEMIAILQLHGNRIEVTSDVLQSIKGNQNQGKKIMEFLIQRQGMEATFTDLSILRETLLWTAADGHDMILGLLLDEGSDVETQDRTFERTMLAQAAANGHFDAVRTLLDAGAYIDSRDLNQRTPSWLAAANRHEAVLLLLLDHGADIDVWDILGETALCCAARTENERMVHLLEEEGAAIEAVFSYDHGLGYRTARDGYRQPVSLSMDDGTRMNVRTDHTWTPLWKAAASHNEAVVQLLLARGAHIDAMNGVGPTPLSMAAGDSDETIVRLLLDKRANIEAKDGFFGFTPLSWAVREERSAVVQLLLDRGADPGVIGSTSPVQLALESNDLDVRRLFGLERRKGSSHQSSRRPRR